MGYILNDNKVMEDGRKFNDTGWMIYGVDYDDAGLQTYFEEPIKKVRFWEDRDGKSFYDVILVGEE